MKEKQTGKTVSRSVYQKLAEENKKLKSELKILCFNGFPKEVVEVKGKWYNHFRKAEDFNSMMEELATNYIKDHPEYDIANSTPNK